ncbi:YkvA family protein [Ammoniphilus sp. YIM 78166]|uniref:YkvA family protein n=1 Tax=Ammoniphilus sp. YIM 78166 TaxID=1644106 RepID=UPI00106F12A3|nr:YkvA family protein [Ammoniphilus sp. YIM 78166]
MFYKLKAWAKKLKSQVFVLYFAYKDNRTPLYAKVFAICVVAYAFSPIDLIPDFIPILGYLDDVILVPLGVMFALKMIPESVIAECKMKAEELMKKGKRTNWFVGSLFILVWILAAIWIALIANRYLFR